ncbi:hypothetical protein NQ318_020844 [Aromia moschata]|uniref:FLYWCH-type domain-containing protein n=1 Tax=Aromia moschata TaxID=1265417 RepID=A0AAV8XQW7_9CUCU|nr:hypothetical protein NQ318_020844 [Aromia moschata]
MPRYIVDGFVFHVNITKGNPPMIYLRCLEYKRLGCHARAVIPYDGMYEFIKSSGRWSLGDDLILHEQIYKFRRNEGKITHWNCFRLDCNATCQTKEGKVVVRMGLHNHAVPRDILNKRRKENKIVRKKLE